MVRIDIMVNQAKYITTRLLLTPPLCWGDLTVVEGGEAGEVMYSACDLRL